MRLKGFTMRYFAQNSNNTQLRRNEMQQIKTHDDEKKNNKIRKTTHTRTALKRLFSNDRNEKMLFQWRWRWLWLWLCQGIIRSAQYFDSRWTLARLVLQSKLKRCATWNSRMTCWFFFACFVFDCCCDGCCFCRCCCSRSYLVGLGVWNASTKSGNCYCMFA